MDIKLNMDFNVVAATCRTCNEALPENRLMIAHLGVGHRVTVLTRVNGPAEIKDRQLQIAMQLKEGS